MVIQRCWRKYRIFSLLPKALKYRRNKACAIIQKVMRGFYEFNLVKGMIREKRLKSCFKFFSNMRKDLYADRVIVIQYHARKYLQRKKVRKLSYEESN